MALDVTTIKKSFPIFDRPAAPGGDEPHRLVYLDSAASSQKPRSVLWAMDDYYKYHHANVHRGVYALAEEATTAYEAARLAVARFIGAASCAA